MMRGNKRAQSATEYAVILAAACLAMVAMQLYAKRAVQGRLKAGTDTIGEQFSPRWSDVSVTTTTRQRAQNTLRTSGESTSTLLDHALTRRRSTVDRFSEKKLTEEALFE
ncbi:MAG: hypothetical protein HYY90_05025 [Candidatus Omnitrophica bacterium]|nr:hypothetical protein [Candidatus Omnitrophota bacterium]MBI3020778.1 hypothetical protein [Candidatus Omnitrophota bacterium]MBI3083706.1 hypothetical protein [Candidatus Omnitrophota bacterium]